MTVITVKIGLTSCHFKEISQGFPDTVHHSPAPSLVSPNLPFSANDIRFSQLLTNGRQVFQPPPGESFKPPTDHFTVFTASCLHPVSQLNFLIGASHPGPVLQVQHIPGQRNLFTLLHNHSCPAAAKTMESKLLLPG